MSEWYPPTTGIELPGGAAERLSVIGGGSWGTTFAKVLADADPERRITLWARRPEHVAEMNDAHRNTQYLPGVNLPPNLRATDSLEAAVQGATVLFLSIPAQAARETLERLRPLIGERTILVSLMKGVERSTGLRMSEVVAEVTGVEPERIAVASGPNIALEIARGEPTAIVVSSASSETAASVARLARNSYLRSFVNTDVVGTEFGGILKNLIAIAVGIVDGVGYGENAKAAVMTRGLAEITDFAVAMGAERETLMGLAGLGDLIATCESPLSRNFTAGRLLGQGYVFDDVIAQMEQTAEGLRSVGPILELARQHGVRMPIAEQIEAVLHGRMSPADLAPHLATDSDDAPQGE